MAIRVLVVDDSAYVRKVLREILDRSPDIEVVGAAADGYQALEKIEALRPDVVILDLYMRGLDGVEFIKEQGKRRPVPVVICSSADREDGQAIAAMEAGAIEFVQKPTYRASEEVYQIEQDLVEKVLAAASVSPERISRAFPNGGNHQQPVSLATLPGLLDDVPKYDALLIGISTGGPQALRWLLPQFAASFPVPIALVLHLPVGYTGPFARRLDRLCQLEVLEAVEGLEMKPGRVIVAQAGLHLSLIPSGASAVAHLSYEPSQSLHCPSVDELFKSASETYGSRVLAIVMTGMGSDGTAGAAWIKAQGGQVYTESESSAIIYGMPRSVVEAGLSDKIVSLEDLPNIILEDIWRRPDEDPAD